MRVLQVNYASSEEFEHEYTSNLVYQDESGALNESMSDIFGNSIEFWADANGLDPAASPDWSMGEDIDIRIPADVVPGFRIGWGVVSGPADELEEYCEAIRKMERARLSANHPEQYAIAPALEADQSHIASMCERLQRRRDITAKITQTKAR